MSQIIFSNLLVSNLKKYISIEDYKNNHPAGTIGQNLKIVKDHLITQFPKFIYHSKLYLHDVLLEMTKFKIGCCFFTNKDNELIGILTDGDIRRLLIKNKSKNIIEFKDINQNYIQSNDLYELIILYKDVKQFIPLIINKKLIGIFRY